jgi:hypothetical protein
MLDRSISDFVPSVCGEPAGMLIEGQFRGYARHRDTSLIPISYQVDFIPILYALNRYLTLFCTISNPPASNPPARLPAIRIPALLKGPGQACRAGGWR